MKRSVKLLLVTATLASPTMPGAIQTAAFAQNATPAASPPAATPARRAAAGADRQVWRREAARELLAYVEAIGEEGLDPAAYNPGPAARRARHRRRRRDRPGRDPDRSSGWRAIFPAARCAATAAARSMCRT